MALFNATLIECVSDAFNNQISQPYNSVDKHYSIDNTGWLEQKN